MKKAWAVLGGLGLGAGLMYILDPSAGQRRRKALADQAGARGRRSAGALESASRDLANHARGIVAEARAAFEGPVDDDVLVARVREALGRAVERPGDVEVAAQDGVVRLFGRVGAQELDGLISTVLRVRGVLDVYEELEVEAGSANM